MTIDDSELESFLRRFQPAVPAPLRHPPMRMAWVTGLAAAATVLVALWGPRTNEPAAAPFPPSRVSASSLMAAVHEDRHEAVLDALAAEVLPDPARADGALRFLADTAPDR